MPPHPLNNFQIQKYCQHEPKFNGVYSKNNFPKTKIKHMSINRNSLDSFVCEW